MFQFEEEKDLDNDDLEGKVIFISLPDAIESEWLEKVNQQHCNVLADINLQDTKILCATVFVMDVQLGQFIINNKTIIGLDKVVVVANEKSHPQLSLLDANRVTPLEYVSLFVEDEAKSPSDYDDQE